MENADIYGNKLTSANIDANLWNTAKNINISFKDAMEFGIKFLNADAHGYDYPECKLLLKLNKYISMLEAKTEECEALRKQLSNEKKEEEIREKSSNEDNLSFDDVFNAKKDGE